ncbi:expressed unknown protein [Seminavis robusta]|uniref:Uncharacterized protein n=1 Tax=Seminavis robusta TaxID=568900 RepID=A0A9N8DWC4_9STRA|nr:expressed unknown protein [Seminavis robusta]|eukprot:Sro323_g117290.1 n/a (582) ;mRNA; r:23338-25344
MEDIYAERNTRFNGGFEYDHPDYVIVSSLSKKKQAAIPKTKELAIVHPDQQDKEETVTVDIRAHDTGVYGHDGLFYLKVMWTFLLATIILWAYWKWIKASRHPAPEDDIDTKEMLSKKKQATSNVGVSRKKEASIHSGTVEVSEATQCIQNLSEQFESVKDKNEALSLEQRRSVKVERQSVLSKKCHESVEMEISEMIQQQEAMCMQMKKSGNSCHVKEHQSAVSRERSPSPPPLVDEEWEDSPPVPRQIPLCSSATRQRRTDNSLSTMPKYQSPRKDASRYPSELVQQTPTKVDGPIQPWSSPAIAATPQQIAREYCETFQIIQEGLQSSGLKLDSHRTAGELTMLHQSSRLKELHAQREFSIELQRQSSSVIEKYDKYLKDLSERHASCWSNIASAMYYSFIVCIMLEGGRCLVDVKGELDYFTLQHFGESFAEMACGCEDNDIRVFVDDELCFPSPMRTLICNVSWLVLGLAHNPKVWLSVTRNMEVYAGWMITQIALSAISAAGALVYYFRARKYLLERQQQVEQERNQGTFGGEPICQGQRMLVQVEDMARILKVFPPVVMLAVLLLFPVPGGYSL